MDSRATSVVMSVFNGQAFLAEAIESILNQTLDDYEFVIVDDGSTDRTAKILAEYASRDERVRVYRHENRGRAVSLNIGIGLARGKYIARMDADDIALPNRLREQIDFMDTHPEVGLLGGAFELISTNGRVLKTVRFPSEDSAIRAVMLACNPFSHPTVVMRKELVSATGGYRKALLDADDYDLWLRISERSQLANLEKCVLQYRVHSNQVSIQNMRHQEMSALAARAAALRRRSGVPDPLTGVEEITPQLLSALGVTAAEIGQGLLDAYGYWMDVLSQTEPEAALTVIHGFLELAHSRDVARSVRADAWLRAASIHYRQGRKARALGATGRAILTRPIVAGRHVKNALVRIAAALRA
jgi:hypothetical protein